MLPHPTYAGGSPRSHAQRARLVPRWRKPLGHGCEAPRSSGVPAEGGVGGGIDGGDFILLSQAIELDLLGSLSMHAFMR
jgi:hypothetical protein